MEEYSSSLWWNSLHLVHSTYLIIIINLQSVIIIINLFHHTTLLLFIITTTIYLILIILLLLFVVFFLRTVWSTHGTHRPARNTSNICWKNNQYFQNTIQENLFRLYSSVCVNVKYQYQTLFILIQ